jgi:hypothetical protein
MLGVKQPLLFSSWIVLTVLRSNIYKQSHSRFFLLINHHLSQHSNLLTTKPTDLPTTMDSFTPYTNGPVNEEWQRGQPSPIGCVIANAPVNEEWQRGQPSPIGCVIA